jgi:hypothetical protein
MLTGFSMNIVAYVYSMLLHVQCVCTQLKRLLDWLTQLFGKFNNSHCNKKCTANLFALFSFYLNREKRRLEKREMMQSVVHSYSALMQAK